MADTALRDLQSRPPPVGHTPSVQGITTFRKGGPGKAANTGHTAKPGSELDGEDSEFSVFHQGAIKDPGHKERFTAAHCFVSRAEEARHANIR